jgi:hypothetical protein
VIWSNRKCIFDLFLLRIILVSNNFGICDKKIYIYIYIYIAFFCSNTSQSIEALKEKVVSIHCYLYNIHNWIQTQEHFVAFSFAHILGHSWLNNARFCWNMVSFSHVMYMDRHTLVICLYIENKEEEDIKNESRLFHCRFWYLLRSFKPLIRELCFKLDWNTLWHYSVRWQCGEENVLDVLSRMTWVFSVSIINSMHDSCRHARCSLIVSPLIILANRKERNNKWSQFALQAFSRINQ